MPPATIIAGNCDPAGDSTFTVEAIGQATGPFPGTFVETITVTIGPQTDEHQPGQFRGDLTAFESTVEITSPAGNVQATTTLDPDEMAVGICSTNQVASWTIAGQIAGNGDYEGQKGAAVASGESNFGFNMYDGDCSCSGSSPDFHHTSTRPPRPDPGRQPERVHARNSRPSGPVPGLTAASSLGSLSPCVSRCAPR